MSRPPGRGSVEPRGLPLAIGRSLLAAAQLAVLLANPDEVLFFVTAAAPEGVRCDGVRAAGLWCLTGGAGPVARIVAMTVLLAVIVGYRPRWTAVPHWYVAASLAVTLPMANGGDRVTQLATMLIVPLCLADARTWQWTRQAPRAPLTPRWQGVVSAAHLAVRAQICVVYGYAAVAKLVDPLWRQGGALAVMSADPYFGLAPPVAGVLGPALGSYWAVAVTGWLVIGGQLVIAGTVLGGRRARRVALALGAALHVTIGVLMDLPVFGAVMVGLLVIGCLPTATGPGRAAERGDDDRDDRADDRAVRSGPGGR